MRLPYPRGVSVLALLSMTTLAFVAASASAQGGRDGRVGGHAAAGRGTPDPRSTITLDATFDARTHSVRGTFAQTFTNRSTAALGSLVFHRYLEAFRDDRSVFMRESGQQLRGVRVVGGAGMELRHVFVNGVDVAQAIERELITGDYTQFRVVLAAPLAVGDSVELQIEFISRLPPLAARAGYVGDFNVLAQWFPKLAKLEQDGTWASFPYHGNGEFYSDFADYDVTLRAPPDFRVEGSGVRVSEVEAGGLAAHHFIAASVHDVAYVVDSHAEVISRSCHSVAVRVSYPRGYAWAAGEHLRATCFGLEYFGRRLGMYPYTTLTVVVPPRGAEGGAGMEYPTAFLTEGPWYATGGLPYSVALETTFHELGHQWFQGLIATNEVEFPLLDEGLTNFIGVAALAAFTHNRDPTRIEFWQTHISHEKLLPPSLPAYRYSPGEYGASVYGRSTLVLTSLSQTYGEARVWAALGRYARRFKFAHPRPDDLIASFDSVFGDGVGRDILAPLLIEGETLQVRVTQAADGHFVARRTGPISLPVDVDFIDATGTHRVVWSGTHTMHDLRQSRGPRCLVIDPERKLHLDSHRRDDTRCHGRRADGLRTLLAAAVAVLLRTVAP